MTDRACERHRTRAALGMMATALSALLAAEAVRAQGPSPGLSSPTARSMVPPGPNPPGSIGAPGAAPGASARPPGVEAAPAVPPLGGALFRRRSGAGAEFRPPGEPPGRGRPRPGSIFDPGAAGPGISQSGTENFLDGALDPRTGWPLVLLDHFRPRPERVDAFWIVQTRDCPQEMGTDPWPCLKVLHFDARGELEERHPSELLAQVASRPALIQVQGSLTTADAALGGMLWTHTWLDRNRALPPDVVVIAFDWPSQRVYRSDLRDINEKGRRAFVAAYHLARFLLAFPPNSRVCLLGQSYGGRVVPSALHLLGGGLLNSMAHDPPVGLPAIRTDLILNGVIIAGASDKDWLDPGQRLDRALVACQAFLNLYNRRDEALHLYPFLIRSGHRRALGRVGLSNRDFAKLGPLAARYAEFDVHDELKEEHTLLDAVANPKIAQMIAPYLFNLNPEPPPSQTANEPRNIEGNRGRRGTR